MHKLLKACVSVPIIVSCACQSHVIRSTDQDVYGLIEQRQTVALGATSDVRLPPEDGNVTLAERAYSFSPRPTEYELPVSFQVAPESDHTGQDATPNETPDDSSVSNDAETEDGDDEQNRDSIFSAEEQDEVLIFGLRDALAQAMRSGRDLQNAREDLYLAALDLTLERHLWTPQFVASATLDADFSDAGGLNDLERAITTVGDVSLTQRLPYGGQVTARVIQTLVRDLEAHVTSGESGSLILEAEVPLLRGAGKVAYESRYSAERAMIYAVRSFERFRRSYLVEVAARYFDLQRTKTTIVNAFKSYENRKDDWERAEFTESVGRSKSVFDALRAKSSFRRAAASLVSAKERYESALDRFKIRIGMSVGELLDVMDQENDESCKAVDALLPDVAQEVAVAVALEFRLDLLSSADQWDDARRGLVNARNEILPDLDFRGSVVFDSDPSRLRGTTFQDERRAWQGLIELKLDDRRTEQTEYRGAQISLRRAKRRHEEFRDNVRADARRAYRRIAQQDNLKRIEAINVRDNELRLEAAQANFDLG
ncbi:MAG: TolC family protein, partial [Planctomycetes bacterium]|nr:TolC family protein [Planctomycetota bacterium]